MISWQKIKPRLAEELSQRGLSLAAELPQARSHRLATWFGSIAAQLPSRLRHVARTNLKICMPHLTAAEQQTLLERSLQEMAKTFLETPMVWKHGAERLDQLISHTNGLEHFLDAQAIQRGAIFVTPHFGNWETLGLLLGRYVDTVILYRPSKVAAIDEAALSGRASTGATMASTTQTGVKQLMRQLGQGKAIALLPDQVPDEGHGVHVPFFGHTAYTMTLFYRLAKKYNCKVYLGYATRTTDQFGLEANIEDISHVVDIDSAEKNAELAAATKLNAEIERIVKKYPEFYMWGYKRFKQQATGEPNIYRRSN